MYSYTKEKYKRVKLDITKVDDIFEYEMVKAKENETFITKYDEENSRAA